MSEVTGVSIENLDAANVAALKAKLAVAEETISDSDLRKITSYLNIKDYGRADINGLIPENNLQVAGRYRNVNKAIISNKKGAIMYRIDDNKSSAQLMAYAGVLDKYDQKFTYCVNAGLFNVDTQTPTACRLLQANGHEIADHTPNHNTKWANMVNEAQATLFDGLAGIVKRQVNKIVFEVDYPSDYTDYIVVGATVNLVAGTKTITGDMSKLTESIGGINMLYIPDYGWTGIENVTESQCTAVWNEHWVSETFTANATVQLYCTTRNNAHMSVDGCRAMLLASMILFKHYGLERPRIFIHPGTSASPALPETLKEAGEALGYIGSSAMVGGVKPKVYNDNDTLARWGDWWGMYWRIEDIGKDASKVLIADLVAKHEISCDAGHFLDANYIANAEITGDTSAERWQNYLLHVDDVAKFCHANDIPVLTYSQKTELLYFQSQNPATNIIPTLYKDILSQGKPDGHTLGAGVTVVTDDGRPEDNSRSLALTGNGTITTITNLTGLEKGENTFEIWIKGTSGAIVTISATDQADIVCTLTGEVWQKFTGTFDIPFATNFITISAVASNNSGNQIKISGLKLRQL